MNKLVVFENPEFGQVRTVLINDEPWFVGKDVAIALGYKDSSDALKKHVALEDKLTRRFTDSGQNREMYVINESGLYCLILSSRLESAKKFKHWVTAEVLPSIRKTGGYIANQENMTESELVAKALLVVHKQLEERNREIERMKPKAIFADAVTASEDCILIGELAKILKANGVNVGQNRLFQWLRENGYLVRRKGTDYNMPTQKSMELKLFKIKETSITHGDGHVTITKTVKVTGKGQLYFINKFMDQE